MKRKILILGIVSILILTIITPMLALAIESQSLSTDWWFMSRYVAGRESHSQSVIKNTDILFGSYELEENYHIVSEPLVCDDKILLNLFYIDDSIFSTWIHCVDTLTGDVLWKKQFKSSDKIPIALIESSSVIDRDHVYLCVSFFTLTGTNGKVECRSLDNGNIIWEKSFIGNKVSNPIFIDNMIYITVYSQYDLGLSVYCLDALDEGKILWNTKIAEDYVDSYLGSSVVDNSDVVSFNNNVVCLDDGVNGDKMWNGNLVESKSFDLTISKSYTPCKWKGSIFKVPDCVEIGDILVMDMELYQESEYMIPGPYNEHSALYIGNNEFIHASDDANATACIRDYSRFYGPAKNLAFVRVTKADSSQRQAAVDWALTQLGASFQDYVDFRLRDPWFDFKCHNPNWRWFPNASEWYCVELLWAAYYNQGIDIDSNGWRCNKGSLFPAVAINEIIDDDDTEIVYCELDDYIEIIRPNRGTYVANKKIMHIPWDTTIVWGKIDVIVDTSFEDVDVIKFYIDGEFKAEDNTMPYSWTWDEKGSGQKQTLEVVAFDENSNRLGSYELCVNKFL